MSCSKSLKDIVPEGCSIGVNHIVIDYFNNHVSGTSLDITRYVWNEIHELEKDGVNVRCVFRGCLSDPRQGITSPDVDGEIWFWLSNGYLYKSMGVEDVMDFDEKGKMRMIKRRAPLYSRNHIWKRSHMWKRSHKVNGEIEKEEKITPEEFYDRMQEIAQNGDAEVAHGDADELMCQVLRQLGYGLGVDAFEDISGVHK